MPTNDPHSDLTKRIDALFRNVCDGCSKPVKQIRTLFEAELIILQIDLEDARNELGQLQIECENNVEIIDGPKEESNEDAGETGIVEAFNDNQMEQEDEDAIEELSNENDLDSAMQITIDDYSIADIKGESADNPFIDENEPQRPQPRMYLKRRDYRCKVRGCRKAYTKQKALNEHINLLHSEHQTFKCEKPNCGELFLSSRLFAKHKCKRTTGQ